MSDFPSQQSEQSEQSEQGDLLTIYEAAHLLGVNPATLRRRIDAGMLQPANHNPALLRPKRLLFRRADIESLARGEQPSPPPPSTSGD